MNDKVSEKKTLTQTAAERACPFCGAWADEKCVRENGEVYGNGRNSFHVARLYGMKETRGGAR